MSNPPATLPANFFQQQGGGGVAPDTLPADFFQKQQSASMTTQPEQPSLLGRMASATNEEQQNIAGGLKQAAMGAVAPAEDAKEHIAETLGGPGGIIAYRLGRKVVGAVENLIEGKKDTYKQAQMDLANAVKEFHGGSYRNAIADTASSVAGTMGLTDPTMEMGRVRDIAQGMKQGGDLATPLTKDVVDLGVAGLSEGLGGAAKGAGKVAGAIEKEGPGLVKQVIKGGKIGQEAAETGLRTATESKAPSLRTSLEEPIAKIQGESKANYKLIDEATDNKFQPNADKLANVNRQLKAIAGTDDAKEAALEASKIRLEWQQEELFEQAAKKGVPAETVSKAKAQFRQSQALTDLDSKVFKNPSIISGNAAHGAEETVDVDKAIRALQKMQDDTEFGSPRLEQALGAEKAKGLLDDLYAAQKAGKKAIKVQKIARWIGVLAGAGEVSRHLLP